MRKIIIEKMGDHPKFRKFKAHFEIAPETVNFVGYGPSPIYAAANMARKWPAHFDEIPSNETSYAFEVIAEMYLRSTTASLLECIQSANMKSDGVRRILDELVSAYGSPLEVKFTRGSIHEILRTLAWVAKLETTGEFSPQQEEPSMKSKWENLKKPKYVSPAESKKIGIFNEKVRFVNVNYDGANKNYTFKTMDETIEVGDLVTVMTDTRHGMTVVLVTETDVLVDFADSIEVHWIVSKVIPEHFIEIVQFEQKCLEKIRQAEFRKLRNDMKETLFKDQEELKKELSMAPMPQVEASKSEG